MGYIPTGPWTNGGAPGISAAFLAALEAYLARIPVFALAGPYTVTTTLTAHNHNLVDQSGAAVIPDMVIVSITGNSSTTAHNAYWDSTTLTTTQVKLIGDGTLTVYLLSIKF